MTTYWGNEQPMDSRGHPQSVPDILSWECWQITPLEYRWAEVDSNVAADESLISPVMSVGSGTFSISFEQRYDFFQPFAPPAGYTAWCWRSAPMAVVRGRTLGSRPLPVMIRS